VIVLAESSKSTGDVQGRSENLFCPEIDKHFLIHSLTDPETRIKLCNTLALPALLYSSENWIIKARDTRRITTAEVKCMRKGTGYTWKNFKTNTEIAKERNITPVLDKIKKYENKLFAIYKQNAP
jgi:hypothetical protein